MQYRVFGILLAFLCSVSSIHADSVQDIRQAIAQHNYTQLEILLKANQGIDIDQFIAGKNSNELLASLEGLIRHADWQQSPEIFVYTDAVVRKLILSRMPKKTQKRFKSVLSKVSSTAKGSRAVARMMDPEYSVEIAAIPKSIIFGSGAGDQKVHVYKPLLEKWYKKWSKKGKAKVDFAGFVRKKVPAKEKAKMRNSIVSYLNVNEAGKYEVSFVNGMAEQAGKVIPNGHYMFVLDAAASRFYIGRKKTGSFHHSSFVSGAPVRSAGWLNISNGKISRIKLSSGHYKPNKRDGDALIQYLSDVNRLGDRAYSIPMEMHGY